MADRAGQQAGQILEYLQTIEERLRTIHDELTTTPLPADVRPHIRAIIELRQMRQYYILFEQTQRGQLLNLEDLRERMCRDCNGWTKNYFGFLGFNCYCDKKDQ